MAEKEVIRVERLGFPFATDNPFLFCAHHKDMYPKGERDLGPAVSLSGRNLGNDFVIKNGFRMYHGQRVPGFPVHPHRGFETVTITIQGYVDHSDSLGAAGRYCNGDVQWMTAGSGCQHAEMFPLVHADRENPLELFQIWLNLPAKDKLAQPHYRMLWTEDIPVITSRDAGGKMSVIRLIAGEWDGRIAPVPSPASWAADPKNHVRILLIRMDPGAELRIPAVTSTISRNLYFYDGDKIVVGTKEIGPYSRIVLLGDEDIFVHAGNARCSLLLLEGEPIEEPIARYGPFVMNTPDEIQEAYRDYRQTAFGGWPWDVPDPVHDIGDNRFARYVDGHVQERRSYHEPMQDE